MSFINYKTRKTCKNFVPTSDRSCRAKNAQKHFLKYLKDRICKIKQYRNYILMLINQNILAILRTNLKRKIYENLYTKETTSKAATTKLLSKIPNKMKISNEKFYL